MRRDSTPALCAECWDKLWNRLSSHIRSNLNSARGLIIDEYVRNQKLEMRWNTCFMVLGGGATGEFRLYWEIGISEMEMSTGMPDFRLQDGCPMPWHVTSGSFNNTVFSILSYLFVCCLKANGTLSKIGYGSRLTECLMPYIYCRLHILRWLMEHISAAKQTQAEQSR